MASWKFLLLELPAFSRDGQRTDHASTQAPAKTKNRGCFRVGVRGEAPSEQRGGERGAGMTRLEFDRFDASLDRPSAKIGDVGLSASQRLSLRGSWRRRRGGVGTLMSFSLATMVVVMILVVPPSSGAAGRVPRAGGRLPRGGHLHLRLRGGEEGAAGDEEEGGDEGEKAGASKAGDLSGLLSVALRGVIDFLNRVVGAQEDRLRFMGGVLGRRDVLEKSLISLKRIAMPGAVHTAGDDRDEWQGVQEGGMSEVLRVPGAPVRQRFGGMADEARASGSKGDKGKEEEQDEEDEGIEGLQVVRRKSRILQRFPFGVEWTPKVLRPPLPPIRPLRLLPLTP